MVTIIQGIRRPNPIADSINNAAKALFGDQLTPALKRSQLNLQEQKFARENAEAIALDNLARTFDTGTQEGRLSNAVRSGFSADNLGKLGLQEAAQGFNGDLQSPDALPLARAQFGAGLATGSTIPGFIASEAQDATLTREGIASTAATARANEAARLAEARFQFENAPLTESQQKALFLKQQFDALTPLQQREIIGATPSQADVQGALLEQNFGNLDALGPRQAATIGALPTETQAKGDVLSRALAESGVNLGSVPEANLLNALDLGAPKPPEVTFLVDPATREVVRSLDNGLTDADTGADIPRGFVPFKAEASLTGKDIGVLEPTATNATEANRAAASLTDFNDLADVLVASSRANPGAFGMPGRINRAFLGAGRLAQGVDQLLGGEGTLQAELDRARQSVVANAATPEDAAAILADLNGNLDEPIQLFNLFAYQTAAAIAGQEGRGLSDRDFKTIKEQALVDPTGLFTDAERFIQGIETVRRIGQQRLARNQERLQGDFTGTAPLPQAAPGAVQEITIDADGNIIQ